MTQENDLDRLHAFIDGSVQGVGFRMFVYDYAQTFGLTGFVRNTYQGMVEVIAEGSREQLENLLGKLRTGPRAAFVTEVKQDWETATGEFFNFEIRRTE